MKKNYYTLVVFDSDRKAWAPQFGDYKKSVVKEEQSEYQEFKTKIICTEDNQHAIDEAIKQLNVGK